MHVIEDLKDKSSYDHLTDEEIIRKVRLGESFAYEYLINKYEHIVKAKARTYFLIGSDRDDVIQEGLIGLYKAICDYDETKMASFRSFAELCITRQIITSIKTATRKKHTPLNTYDSIYKAVQEDQSERTLLDVIDDTSIIEPQKFVLTKDNNRLLRNKIQQSLTRLELQVLTNYLKGYSYEEIARIVKRSEKSIDNALQRVKRKIQKQLREEN